jgi:hypothetical protein
MPCARQPQGRDTGSRLLAALWVVLLFVGILSPSSINGVHSSNVSVYVWVGLLCIMTLLIIRSGRTSSWVGVLAGVLTASIPWLVTGLRRDAAILPGLGLQFIFLGAVYVLSVSTAPCHLIRRAVLPVIEILMAIAALAVMFGVPGVGRALASWYGQYYDTLVALMVAARKPVGVFGTHSVAAFAYYLLVFYHTRTYEKTGSVVELLYSCFWLVVIGALASSTAAAMLIVGGGDICVTALRSSRQPFRWLIAEGVAAGCVIGLIHSALVQSLPFGDLVSRVLGNQSNGLLSRYNTNTGVVSEALSYLRDHPFSPVGLADVASVGSSLSGQTLGDSGPVTYLLRGGLLLICSVYVGLDSLLLRAVGNKKAALWVWLVTLAFELGFSVLLVPRVVILMLMIATSLGDLHRSSVVPVAVVHDAAGSRGEINLQ